MNNGSVCGGAAKMRPCRHVTCLKSFFGGGGVWSHDWHVTILI